ncbi:pilus assembly protein [Xanthomonas bonasiae]|uniref:pilus assembly protein n=1 Tax=Xanthomonas bonasiae TaxID=2810351 RepID=UPI001F133A5F|nr:PilC/PilY family type IV pilus protein [Xanthomonas bonasiae]
MSAMARVRGIRIGLTLSCLPVVVSMPAAAATSGLELPDNPLITDTTVAPNILFILDDSGSMDYTYMPDSVPATSTVSDVASKTYARNTIYYNPATSYAPWVDSTGTEMTGGTSYDSVYSSLESASGSTTSLYASVQTFYVPKNTASTDTAVYLANGANYYRYQILTSGAIYRSEYTTYSAANTPAGASSMGCATSTSGSGWRNCVRTTPTGRSEAAERSNFAIWYSYFRTRNKVAKASAGRAFSELGSNVRVGFRTIWARQLHTLSSNYITNAYPIPVNNNDGLFVDPNGTTGANNNRTLWYDRLYSANASDSTPLRGALASAGTYFSSTASAGPYGPESDTNQYACRQNFAILTTDGYWNESGYTPAAGEQDNASGSTISGPSGNTYTYTPARPYSSAYADTLADVAMRYWKNDLRSDLSNIVPTNSDDPAFWQHMVTFGISIGAAGTLDPSTDLAAITAGTLSWPKPVNNTIVNIDDLWHATVNGHGSFVVASDPDSFVTALQSALAAITERTGSGSNISATSTSLSSSTQLFSALYVSGTWSGQLLACAATVSTCNASSASWLATAGMPAATARTIVTYENAAGASFPTTTQQTTLGGADIASYLRGDQSNEKQNGGTLRNRSTVLGDIVDSTPAYVGDTGTVYVGANDGMLHAFDAGTGAELFAYVPGALAMRDLATLADPDYTHQFFVDGPVVASTRTQTSGRNILVGALGRGGKGLYALDVSSPTAFSASSVLWEKTETSAGNMGQVLGQPFIAKLNNGVTALVTGNGINSGNGHAVLLVYNLSTGALIRELDTGSGGTTTATSNGLFAPTGWDADGSGTVDYVYAGDLQGHVWKFDLSASAAASWSVGNGAAALFSATSSAGVAQPITGGVLVAEDPGTSATWVFFGTGRYLVKSDIQDTSVQTMYGIIDAGATVARSGLTARSIAVSTTSSGYSVRGFQSYAALPAGSQGWSLDLLTDASNPQGERVVGTPVISGTTLVFSSIIPSSSACQSNGTSYVNAISAFTGTSTKTGYFDLDGNGSTSNDTLITSAGASVAVGSVAISSGMASVAALLNGKLVVSDSSGTSTSLATSAISPSRVSWREVIKEK